MYSLIVHKRSCPFPHIILRGSLNCASSPAVTSGSSPLLLFTLTSTWQTSNISMSNCFLCLPEWSCYVWRSWGVEGWCRGTWRWWHGDPATAAPQSPTAIKHCFVHIKLSNVHIYMVFLLFVCWVNYFIWLLVCFVICSFLASTSQNRSARFLSEVRSLYFRVRSPYTKGYSSEHKKETLHIFCLHLECKDVTSGINWMDHQHPQTADHCEGKVKCHLSLEHWPPWQKAGNQAKLDLHKGREGQKW